VLEFAPLRVNQIAAGFIDSPLSASSLGDALEDGRDQLRSTLPIGRVVEPADVAALAVQIMTNTALTGETYDIDGGEHLCPPEAGDRWSSSSRPRSTFGTDGLNLRSGPA
jgi:NAD(P)-dependent dehydrogenase (short-subunit alcohol dehydrogenase family)